MSVGLEYKSVWMTPSSNETLVSKKAIVFGDQFAVNFMDGWQVLRWFRNNSSCEIPCVQMANTSSMYRHQTSGCNGWDKSCVCSKWPMNKLAYEGAIRVPMAVPFVCKYCLPLNVKLLLLRIMLIRSHRSSVGGMGFSLVSRAALQASKPSE